MIKYTNYDILLDGTVDSMIIIDLLASEGATVYQIDNEPDGLFAVNVPIGLLNDLEGIKEYKEITSG